MYTFIYITVKDWKLQYSICFKKFWVHTPLKFSPACDTDTVEVANFCVYADRTFQLPKNWHFV